MKYMMDSGSNIQLSNSSPLKEHRQQLKQLNKELQVAVGVPKDLQGGKATGSAVEQAQVREEQFLDEMKYKYPHLSQLFGLTTSPVKAHNLEDPEY